MLREVLEIFDGERPQRQAFHKASGGVAALLGSELLRIDTVCMTNRDTLSAWHQLSACVSILRLYER